MTERITTRPSTKEYRKGWERVFGGNIWKCPKCGKEVDYGDCKLAKGLRTWCSKTNQSVKVVRV